MILTNTPSAYLYGRCTLCDSAKLKNGDCSNGKCQAWRAGFRARLQLDGQAPTDPSHPLTSGPVQVQAARVDPREGLQMMEDLDRIGQMMRINPADIKTVRIPEYTGPMSHPMGWECPRCHGVWGPNVMGCNRCNATTVVDSPRIIPDASGL